MRQADVTSPDVEAFKGYVAANKSLCRDCRTPIFWCSTSTGKRVPVDFPNSALYKPTHALVPTYKDGAVIAVEVWPHTSKPTHSLHLRTCEGAA